MKQCKGRARSGAGGERVGGVHSASGMPHEGKPHPTHPGLRRGEAWLNSYGGWLSGLAIGC
jgi:hypothetical protein